VTRRAAEPGADCSSGSFLAAARGFLAARPGG